MAKDPRRPPPGSPEPDEALELLRALARGRGNAQAPEAAPQGGEKLDALRDLAAKLDFQLRGGPGGGPPGPRPPGPPGPRPPPLSQTLVPPPAVPPGMDEPTVRPAWHARLLATVRREWRALVAALPEGATLVPRFGRGQIVFIGISVGVLLIAAIGGLVGVRGPRVASDQAVPPIAPAAPTAPSALPTPADATIDLAAIKKGMTDCDADAAKSPDSIYFYVLPLRPAKGAENDWRTNALSEVGNTFLLLSGQDALDGLRDGKLIVRPGRYTFAMQDSASGQSVSWTSATAASRLSKPVPATVRTLKLGFDFSPTQTGTTWSNEFKRDAGTCYWVSVLVGQ